jgi:DNA-3-methyladenine glycosylase II
MSTIAFELRPTPPFRLDLTVWTLRRRPTNLIDTWDGQDYRRVLMVQAKPVEVCVRQTGAPDSPRLQVQAAGANARAAVTAALERLLGLQIDLTGFYRLAARDSQLAPLATRFRGMKPPRYPTIFEALVNAIACQQITLTQGIVLLNRLTENYGRAGAFPRPEDLSQLNTPTARKLGLSQQKTRAIRELARGMTTGRVDVHKLDAMDDVTAVEYLEELHGVGRWTAEYVLLRGLGRLEVFPGDDVGARNNLQRWLGLKRPLDYEEVRAAVAKWQPYAGLVYFHLLLDRLAEHGYVA